MTKTKIQNVSFTENSRSYKICKDFVDGITDVDFLANKHNTTPIQVYSVISHFKQKLRIVNGEGILEVQARNTTNQNSKPSSSILSINIIEENNQLVLKLKASQQFEDYLKRTKELCTTTNLWNKGQTGKYYRLQLIANYLDDINRPIFYSGQLNFAVLRLQGISQGITLNVDGLLSENQVKLALTKMTRTFKDFFKSNIDEITKINIQAEVLLE